MDTETNVSVDGYIEDISRRLAFFREPWGNMIELSETLPGAGA
jgi:glyoxylase I family protein